MGALSDNRYTRNRVKEYVEIPAGSGVRIYAGGMVCLNASRYAAPAANSSDFIFVGVATEECDNRLGGNGAIKARVNRSGIHLFAGTGLAQSDVGKTAWVYDDQTIVVSDPGHSVKCGTIVGIEGTTGAWVDIETSIIIGSTLAGTSVTLADSGSYFGTDTAEAGLQQVGAELAVRRKGTIQPTSLTLEAGTVLTAFSAAPTPGWAQLSNKEVVLKWAHHSSPASIAATFLIPDDLDGTASVTVHFMAYMSGTTDTPDMVMEAYFDKGDTDCAGTDDEIDGGTTLTEYYMTIAHGDVPDAGPTWLTIIMNPKSGELANDDVYVYGIWVEYTKKVS